MNETTNTQADSGKDYPATIMFVAIILATTIIPTITRGLSLPQYFILIFSAGVILIFCLEYYRKYTNILLFSILAFLLTSVFPLFHYLVYKNNNNSYFFEKYYLDYNVSQSKSNAEKYSSIPYLNHFLKTASDSILFLDPTKLTLENQISTDSIIIISSSVISEKSRHPGDYEPVIRIYTKKFRPINFIRVKGLKTLGDVIKKHFAEFNEISDEIKAPDKNIMMSDFWVESVTGFVFSYIKPLSNTARFLRVLQLITAFLLISMLINTMSGSNKLVLKRK